MSKTFTCDSCENHLENYNKVTEGIQKYKVRINTNGFKTRLKLCNRCFYEDLANYAPLIYKEELRGQLFNGKK
jgi:hypothetical protein